MNLDYTKIAYTYIVQRVKKNHTTYYNKTYHFTSEVNQHTGDIQIRFLICFKIINFVS